MLHSRQQRRFTPEEYLLLEERAETRSEYCRGEIFAMSGGTVAHNRIVRNILGLLDTALSPSKCEAFPSDLRLYVEKSQLFTYPDVLVVCGELPYLPGRSDTLTDATLLVEVLSPSTQEYDRGDKFRLYRGLPAFAEYLLVSQNEVRLEQHVRQSPGTWLMKEWTSSEDHLELPSLAITLDMASVYRGVSLQA